MKPGKRAAQTFTPCEEELEKLFFTFRKKQSKSKRASLSTRLASVQGN
jgi:hypothetical protein